MSEDLRESLHIIQSHTPLVNQTTDEANALVRTVEALLEHSAIGIEESIPANYANVHGDTAFLGYKRVGDKFRIVVEWAADPMSDLTSLVPWSECSRVDKLATIRSLPALLRRLTFRLSSQLDYATQAKEALNEVKAALAAFPNASPHNAERNTSPNISSTDDVQNRRTPRADVRKR